MSVVAAVTVSSCSSNCSGSDSRQHFCFVNRWLLDSTFDYSAFSVSSSV